MDLLRIKEFSGTYPNRYKMYAKLDGIQAIFLPKEGKVVSRADKPLYNLGTILSKLNSLTEPIPTEVYLGTFRESLSAVRTQKGTPIHTGVYDLMGRSNGILPRAPEVNSLEESLRLGYEGCMIENLDTGEFLRWKPFKTIDIPITGIVEGSGRNKGRVGALLTDLGNIGIGLSDVLRIEFWKVPPIGKIVEVKYQYLTQDGKMRHASFVRLRPDK